MPGGRGGPVRGHRPMTIRHWHCHGPRGGAGASSCPDLAGGRGTDIHPRGGSMPFCRNGLSCALAATVAALVLVAPAAAFNADVRVSEGSPLSPFSQNKQNEPAMAVDAAHPNVM